MVDVRDRYRQLAVRRPELRWYALLDGYQHERCTGTRLVSAPGINQALFDGTPEASLADAGPWLHDLVADAPQADAWARLERATPCVSWLITAMDLQGLAQVLQLKLHAELPDGRAALLRFYDPRVLANLAATLDGEQRSRFFDLIEEWHFLVNGRRVWMARPDHA